MSTPPRPHWDERYDRADYLFGTAPNAFLVAARHHIRPGGRVLCVADGEGRNGVWLAGEGFAVDAFEPSAFAVEKARRLADERGVEINLDCADADGWAWPEAAYDAVAAIFIQFADPALRRRIFARAASALVPGGVLLLQGYRPEQLAYGTGGPRDIANLYAEDVLRAELAHLEIVELRSYDAVLSEGAGHDGMSALIDVVARRAG